MVFLNYRSAGTAEQISGFLLPDIVALEIMKAI